MRDLLTVERVANQIRLRRSIYQGTFLLVEGRSDKTFYERFVDSSSCQLVTTSGKPSSKLRAISILEILEESNFKGVLAIVDADFDHLSTQQYQNSNLLYTDTHDLETMIIKSPAFDKVIAEFCSEDKICKFNQDIRIVILESSVLIGYLLWISQCDKLNLTFEGIRFSRFVDKKTLKIDELKLVQEVKKKSQAFSLKDEDLQQRLIRQKSNDYNPWQVCCGHDLVEILSLGLRETIGSNKASDVNPVNLERSLRLAYEEIYFQETQLYSLIRIWESNNEPFRVLQMRQNL